MYTLSNTIYVIRIIYTKATKKKNLIWNLPFTVGQFAIFAHSHGLLLNVVLSEKSRLTGDHLHDGRRNDHIFDGLVGASGLPLFRRNDLEVNQRERYGMSRRDEAKGGTTVRIHY